MNDTFKLYFNDQIFTYNCTLELDVIKTVAERFLLISVESKCIRTLDYSISELPRARVNLLERHPERVKVNEVILEKGIIFNNP